MATGNERLKGIQVHRPIIYGSHARLLTDEEKLNAPAGHTHRWTVFLTSAATPTPEPRTAGASSLDPPPIDLDYLPGGDDDMSYVLKRVVFRLHETYPNPNRMCERPPYRVTETGWGEFTVQIKVTFIPEAAEKALTLQHPIKLHHWGEPIEAPPPATETPAGVPPAEEVKTENGTPADATAVATATVTATATAATTAATTAAATPAASASAPTSAAPTPAADRPALQIQTQSIASIAATYPVHAWQYDEMIFSDPPAQFMQILEEHPPTPLPARPRRPRDQREQHELRTGKKRKPPAAPVAARAVSRAGTATPRSRAGTPRGATPSASAAATPGGLLPPVGVPGELGSADVPLEYALDMEKAEQVRLTEIRVRIVEQMDRWRERLIAQERELTRLKEDMRNHA